MFGKTFLFVILFLLNIQDVLLQCLSFTSSQNAATVTKENGKPDITIDWSGAINQKDWTFFDYVQFYDDNGTRTKKVEKGEEDSGSSVNKTIFHDIDICKAFTFEVKFFEEGSRCEKFSITTKYDPVDFFDLETPPENEKISSENVTSFRLFPKTNLVNDDDDFLKCIVFTNVMFEEEEMTENTTDDSFLVDMASVRDCENATFHMTYRLRNEKEIIKQFRTNICPYAMSLLEKGLLFGGIGALALVSLLTVAVTVHKKMESRQFLDVVVDYSCKDDDTQDVKYLQI